MIAFFQLLQVHAEETGTSGVTSLQGLSLVAFVQ